MKSHSGLEKKYGCEARKGERDGEQAMRWRENGTYDAEIGIHTVQVLENFFFLTSIPQPCAQEIRPPFPLPAFARGQAKQA